MANGIPLEYAQLAQATGDQAIAPRSAGKYVAQVALVSVAQFAAGKLGDLLQGAHNGGIGPVWPASGIAVGALLLYGYSVWPGIAIGAFLLALFGPLPPWAAALYAAGTTLAALLAVFLLRRMAHFDLSLSRLRDVLALIGLGAFGSSVVSASIGASTLYAAHIRGWSGFGLAWLVYWLGDSTGVLLITPLVLTLPSLFAIRDRRRLIELAALLLFLTATCFVIFGDLSLIHVGLHVLAFAVLPFAMWAAIRFGMGATTLSIVLIATIATVETALGSGPFVTPSPLRNAVLLDAFFAVVSVTGLTLAAAIAEREESEHQRRLLVRKQAGMEARLRLAAIVESSHDAIVSKDLDGVIASWNAGAERIFGYTAVEAVGQPITMLIPPELQDEENEILQRLRAGERIENLETIRITKAGKRVDVCLIISPVKDASGQVVGASKIARDITERKRAEKAFRESEMRYRRMVETTNEGVWLLDATLHTSYVNRQMAEMLGYEAQEMLGRSVFDFYFPEDVEYKKQVLSRRQQGLREQRDERLRRRDGSELWIRMAATPLFKDDGEFNGALALMSDITERKLAEEALRQSEERLRLAAQAGNMYAYEWDVTTDVLVRSSEYVKILGETEPQRYNREEFLDKIHPDDYPKFIAAIQGLAPESPTAEVTYRVMLPSGTIWLKNSARAFFGEDGKLLRTIGMVADVTDHKLAEEALSNMAQKLVDAQEKERTRIARELHDDINQRLAVLAVELGQVEANRQDLPPEVLKRMGELRKQTTQISRDVQALSHDLHSQQLEYLGLVAGIRSWCREFGERQGLQVDCRHDVQSVLPAEIGLCLFRVLQEALHNAAKHSGEKRIEVHLAETSGVIHLIVKDSGKGFDTEAARQGRGLGLTSMQERVRLVNGTIQIRSKPMGGTTIHVRVPFTPNKLVQRAAG